MIDLKQASIELEVEKTLLNNSIRALISEFENKTGFIVEEIITKEVNGYSGRIIRSHSVKLTL